MNTALPLYTEFSSDPGFARWYKDHAEEIRSSGRRTHPCWVCKSVRIPANVHACHLCD